METKRSAANLHDRRACVYDRCCYLSHSFIGRPQIPTSCSSRFDEHVFSPLFSLFFRCFVPKSNEKLRAFALNPDSDETAKKNIDWRWQFRGKLHVLFFSLLRVLLTWNSEIYQQRFRFRNNNKCSERKCMHIECFFVVAILCFQFILCSTKIKLKWEKKFIHGDSITTQLNSHKVWTNFIVKSIEF